MPDDLVDLDGLDNIDEGTRLLPACCHFCGALTDSGLMVFPKLDEEAVWPVCEPCMEGAFKRGGMRNGHPVPAFVYARSPN